MTQTRRAPWSSSYTVHINGEHIEAHGEPSESDPNETLLFARDATTPTWAMTNEHGDKFGRIRVLDGATPATITATKTPAAN